MPTLIDSLIVSLSLDPKDFTKGQKQAVAALKKIEEQSAHTAKEVQASGKAMADAFVKVRNEVLALGAAFLGVSSIRAFADKITGSDAALGRLANNVGMSTEDLSAWEGAAERAGGSAQGMAATIKTMTQQMQEFRTKGALSADLQFSLAQSGVDANKYLSASTSNTERFLMVADKFSKMDPAEAQMLGRGFGFDESTVNLLMKGRGAVQELYDKQMAMNAVTKADTEAAIGRQTAWLNLADTMERFGRTVLNDVSPALIDLMKQLQVWIEKNRDWIATDIAGALKKFIAFVNDASDAVGGWVRVLWKKPRKMQLKTFSTNMTALG